MMPTHDFLGQFFILITLIWEKSMLALGQRAVIQNRLKIDKLIIFLAKKLARSQPLSLVFNCSIYKGTQWSICSLASGVGHIAESKAGKIRACGT